MGESVRERDNITMTNEPTPNDSEDATSEMPSADGLDSTAAEPTTEIEDVASAGEPGLDSGDTANLADDSDATDGDAESVDADVDDGDSFDGGSGGSGGDSGYVPPQPPPVVTVPPVRRLVRDPYSRLGGVASGISHHYGIDVSLVRIGFIVATVFSGIGLILYFLAWLIIPRAEYWPPVPAGADGRTVSPIEGRELAYGLLTIGILLAVFAGGGNATRLIISVGLVGAGIWMLMQPPRSVDQGPAVGANPPTPAGQPVPPTEVTAPVAHPVAPASWQPAPADAADTVSGSDELTSGYAVSPPPPSTSAATATAPTQTVYIPAPVPPRRRRIWPIVLILSLFILPVLFGLVIFGLIIGLGTGGFNGDFDAKSIEIRPATIEDLPDDINLGAGQITLDLTNLDETDFAELTSPYELDIDLNAGEVVVEIPSDIPVSVDASVGAGDVTVFDNSRDGIRPRIDTSEEDAVLELDIRVGVGEISVER